MPRPRPPTRPLSACSTNPCSTRSDPRTAPLTATDARPYAGWFYAAEVVRERQSRFNQAETERLLQRCDHLVEQAKAEAPFDTSSRPPHNPK